MLPTLVPPSPGFRTHAQIRPALRDACDAHSDIARYETIGESEEGRPLAGIVLGTGDCTVSLIAGNHADEPVGPETLRTLVLESLARRAEFEDLFERVRFLIVPHTNPDGEARNRPWIKAWPDLEAYAQHVVREAPGRDLEYGYPEMRPENAAVASFLARHAPLAMHASLHGMSTSEGAMLLINRPWTFRTQPLRTAFRDAAADAGLRMHDHNRKGEKGFFWIEPGFQTTPRGDAMRTFFRAQDDDAMAERFHDSSMEFAMHLGGDPLALVTELPLWVVRNEDPTPGRPDVYLELRSRFPAIQQRLAADEPVDDLLAPFDLRPLDLSAAMRLQLRAIELGLEAVWDA